MLGQGIYNLPEAARLTGLKVSRVREWFTLRVPGKGRRAVFASDYAPVDGDRVISFLDLVELFVAGQLRERGVSLQRLRAVHARLRQDWDVKHPFCRKELLVSPDGRQVFTHGLDPEGHREVVEVLTNQRAFPDVLLPFLRRLDYDPITDLAIRWRIADGVMLDPAIRLGKPIVEGACKSTYLLASAYEANGRDAERVAYWYGVGEDHVRSAVAFERRLAA